MIDNQSWMYPMVKEVNREKESVNDELVLFVQFVCPRSC